jgi:hypothetical protein
VAAAVTATVLAVASLFFVENRSPDYDPQYARDIVERALKFGGSYYVNGIHDKGPLEVAVYDVVRRLTSFDAFWFGIAVLVMVQALLIGLVARRVVALIGGPVWLGWSALVSVYLHFALSGADYAGVLYSRNMTAALLSTAFLLLVPIGGLAAVVEAPRRRVLRLLVAAVALGLSVQTLLTTALSVSVLSLFALLVIPAGRSLRRGPHDRALFVSVEAVTFFAAPLYYRVFGPWQDYWNGYWVFGRYMSASTGRSLWGQLGLGWHQFYIYSRAHAPAHLCVVAFVLLGMSRWDRLSTVARRLQVLLPIWWVAAWFEIILTQRYSSHYFVVTSVPAALMIVGVAVHLVATYADGLLGRRGAMALGASVVVVSLVWTGTSAVITGLQRGSNFRSVADVAYSRSQSKGGDTRTIHAVVELVSRDDDPLLTWTNYPWSYLDLHRVSATRFIWKSFLVGETYLGATSTRYILPGSWSKWQADVDQAHPVMFLTEKNFPVPTDNPAGQLLASAFTPVIQAGSLTLSLRTDAAQQMTAAVPGSLWQPVPGGAPSGWTTSTGTAQYAAPPGTTAGTPLRLGDLRCRRLDADVIGAGSFDVAFVDPTGRHERLELQLHDDHTLSRSPNVTFLDHPTQRSGTDHLTLIVGTDAAALLVNGQLTGAVDLVPGTSPTLAAVGPSLSLASISVGAGLPGAGC